MNLPSHLFFAMLASIVLLADGALRAEAVLTPDPVETKALRIEVQQQSGWSAGILEWKVD